MTDFAGELMQKLEASRAKTHKERWIWADVPIESVTLLDWRRYTVLSARETAHLRALARRRAGRWQRDMEAVAP